MLLQTMFGMTFGEIQCPRLAGVLAYMHDSHVIRHRGQISTCIRSSGHPGQIYCAAAGRLRAVSLVRVCLHPLAPSTSAA